MAQKNFQEDVTDYDPLADPLALDVLSPEEMRLDAGSGSKGEVQLTDDVIVAIVKRAVGGVKGTELAGAGGNWFGGSKAAKESVSVKVGEDGASCEIHLQVKMQYDIPLREVAGALQHHVKEVVERMTGRPVSGVHVKIVGLTEPKDAERA